VVLPQPFTRDAFREGIQRCVDSLFAGCPVPELERTVQEIQELILAAREAGFTRARGFDEIELAWQPEAFRQLDLGHIPRGAYSYMFEDQLLALGLEPECMPKISHTQ
jgi:hypothetical protein